jgi:hypothetical protein
MRDQKTRAQTYPVGQRVGLACQHRAHTQRGCAQMDRAARRNFETREQNRIGDRAEDAVFLRQKIGERCLRIGLDCAR